MDTVEHYLVILRALGAEPFCLVLCVAWGYFVRLIPAVSNKWMPVVCIAAGLCYPFLLPAEARHPWLRTGAFGFILGVVAFVLHISILRRIEHKIPFLKGLLTRADAEETKRYRKKANGSFEEIEKP